jgi:hypothetical protein
MFNFFKEKVMLNVWKVPWEGGAIAKIVTQQSITKQNQFCWNNTKSYYFAWQSVILGPML